MRAIAEEGGVTRATARLHLTQSAVSHQLADLEGRLGVALFARVRGQLHLTAAGERLLEAARRLLPELDRVERELYRPREARREHLRLCVESFTAYHWLPGVAVALGREHPLVDLRVVLEARQEPVAALLRGALDLAIVSSPLRDRDLVQVPLADDEWTVAMAPEHPLASRSFVAAADLGEHRLYVHDSPRSDVERLRDIAAAEKTRRPPAEIVPLTETLLDFVRAGAGLGLVSSWAVAPAVARGDLVARRFTRAGLPETWSAVYRRDARDRLPLARLAELVRDVLQAGSQAAPRRATRKHRGSKSAR